MKKNKIHKLTKVTLMVVVLTLVVIMAGCSKSSPEITAFAKCLKDNGAKMYGAYWCGHCEDQKKAFGDGISELDYIECSLPNRQGQTEFCTQAGIESYPTWEFADGEKLTGKQNFETLGLKTGCTPP